MSILEFVFLLIVAGIVGSIEQSLAGHSAGGCLLSIVVGFIGALLGTMGKSVCPRFLCLML